MAGENPPLLDKLVGHRRHRTTAGYAHLSDGHLVATVEQVGLIIATAMESAQLRGAEIAVSIRSLRLAPAATSRDPMSGSLLSGCCMAWHHSRAGTQC